MSSPFTVQFPTAIDDARSLGIAANDAAGALASPGLAIGGSSFSLGLLADANEFGESGAITIDNEIVYFTRSGNAFTVTQRGAEGTVEAAHAAGVTAEQAITAGYHTAHSAAIQAIETKIGFGASTPVAGAFLVGGGTVGSSSWRALAANDIPDLSATYAVVGHNHAGVYQPLDQDLTDIAALTANGLLRRTAGVWGMDGAAYLTANQTITLSGDVTGSGTTAITTTLATVNSAPGSFGSASKTVTATVTAKGLVTGLSEQNIAIAASQITSGTLPIARGGTGLATIASGKLLYASALDTLAELTLAATFTITTGTLDVTAGGITNAMLAGSIANAKLTNSAIAIAGTLVSLGGSISLDTIMGLASTGLIKRTGANTLAAAVAGTDYEVPLTFSTGLTRSVNTITVNTSQNIAKLTNLTSNGFVKTSAGDGTLIVDTNTYLTANQTITLSGDISGSGSTAITVTIGAAKVTNAMLAGSIAAAKLVGTDIATVGTVTAGTWNATAIGAQYGGTGLNTSASTGYPSLAAGTWSIVSAATLMAALNVMVGDSGSGGTKGLVAAPAAGDAAANKYWKADGTWATVTATTTFANPTGTIGLNAVTGTATTAMRSDAAPALDVAIAPTWTNPHTFVPGARSSGAANYWTLRTPADTGLTASTEAIGAQFGGNSSASTVTRQWAAGALAKQRENVFVAPTYSFTAASVLTTAATVAITGAPVPGTNATINNRYSLMIESGDLGMSTGANVYWGVGGSQQGMITGFSSGLYFTGNAGGVVIGLANWGGGILAARFGSGGQLQWDAGASPGGSGADLVLRRAAAANLALGATDAASPVAQTISVQNVVAGTSNTAGATWTHQASLGTSQGTPGRHSFTGGAMIAASGTTQQTAVSRFEINATKVLPNNSATTIVNVTAAAGSSAGGQLCYYIEVTDGTDYQYETGMLSFGVTNKGGVFSGNTVTKHGNQQNATAGTLAVTFAISGANPALLTVNANSSLTPSTGYPRIVYWFSNCGNQAIAIQ